MPTSRALWAIGIVCLVCDTADVPTFQAPAGPAFEVASVKPNKSRDGERGLDLAPGGRFTATYATLRDLITLAYQLPNGHLRHDSQIVGGPRWINSDRFDIVAKADPGRAGVVANRPAGAVRPGDVDAIDQFRLTLRKLLGDRFQLTVHHEMRQLPVYALVVARRDGKLGPELHKVDVDCAAQYENGRRPSPPGPGQAACGGFTGLGPGRMAGHGVTMAMLATSFPGSVGRIVVDRTKLSGVFDLNLTWTPDQLPPQGDPGSHAPPPADGPSIFAAVQEQLGLKLDPQRSPVDVLVVDRAEHPTAD
jgi:bla regulator protein blaR1